MGLYERLEQARAAVAEEGEAHTESRSARESNGDASGGYEDLRRRIHESLLHSLGPKLYDVSMRPEKLQTKVRTKLVEVLDEEGAAISAAERKRLVAEITDDILGYGPIEPFLRDPSVSEVMVNGPGLVYVEREGKLYRTEAAFADEAHLRRIIEKIVGQVGRRVDESQPYVDARLPDGSRVNAIIPPVALDGPALTVRKFAHEPYRAEDLVRMGTFSPEVAAFLEACVRGRLNILVSGGTGVGKTTTLNVLSSFVPDDERIVTIEDAAELKLQQPHVVRCEHRPPNIEGKGEITIRDLVRNALRMRPDRIIVGEVRGGEALDMLQAMNTGHDGGISTIHANSPRDAVSRLETMVLMAGMELPVRAIRQQAASAIQLIVHQSRLKDGTRKVTHVTEVVGMEGDVVTLQDLFTFDYGEGVDEHGRFRGRVTPTGLRPKFAERLEDVGIVLDAALFEPDGPRVTQLRGRREKGVRR